LVPDLFVAFCSVLFATHDYAVHNPDDSPGMFFDTRAQEIYPANAYCGLAVMNDSLSFSLSLLY
jgi:hypothetical protein